MLAQLTPLRAAAVPFEAGAARALLGDDEWTKAAEALRARALITGTDEVRFASAHGRWLFRGAGLVCYNVLSHNGPIRRRMTGTWSRPMCRLGPHIGRPDGCTLWDFGGPIALSPLWDLRGPIAFTHTRR
jgi:hypothetical protein